MTDRPTAFHDLPPSAFPVTFRAYRTDNDELVWEEVITGVAVVQIPPLSEMHGCPIRVSLETADGQVVVEEPS